MRQRSPRHWLVLTALGALLVIAAPAPTPAEVPGAIAQAQRLNCGVVSGDYPEGNGGSSVLVEAINLRCRAAKRVTRLCIVHHHIPNWRVRVSEPDARASLSRAGKRIVMRFQAGGPPFCI